MRPHLATFTKHLENCMKSSFMRPAMALALALGMAACGGKATFEVSGTVSGLVYPGLILTNNGTDLAIAPPPTGTTTTFRFPSIDYGQTYDVKVKPNADPLLPPANPQHQTCSVLNGTDTAGRLATIDISVVCSIKALSIGGTVSGLTADGLVLTNGSTGGTAPVPKDATTFVFAVPVPYKNSYGVSVLTQPTGLKCSVSPNGTGIMGDVAITNIAVTCVPNPPAA
jgi:hypothetical protein